MSCGAQDRSLHSATQTRKNHRPWTAVVPLPQGRQKSHTQADYDMCDGTKGAARVRWPRHIALYHVE